MSQCFRNISTRFTTVNSVLNSRKHVAQLDKQLPHQIKPSPFLEEFLNARTITSLAASPKPKLQDLALLSTCDVWREACEREGKPDPRARVSFNPIMSAVKRYEISSDDIVACGGLYDDPKSFERHELESLENTYSKLSNSVAMLRMGDSVLSDFEKRAVLLADSTPSTEQAQTEPPLDPAGKPSQAQLQHIHDVLAATLPTLFIQPLDYRIYHMDVEFVNNIRGMTTRGLLNYVKQVALLRTVGHLKFAYVKFEILKITTHPEDDTVKVRWRIRGISGIKAFIAFWKIKLWKMKETFDHQELWYDGFSTFHVNGEGLIYRHVADKMMPDQDENRTAKDQNGVTAKLALFLGLLVPGETLSELCSLTSASNCKQHCSLVTGLNGKTQSLEADLLPLVKMK